MVPSSMDDPENGPRALAITGGTCTDSQHCSRKDDQLESSGHFADSHQDGRDDGEDTVDLQGPCLQGQQSPEGRGLGWQKLFRHQLLFSRAAITQQMCQECAGEGLMAGKDRKQRWRAEVLEREVWGQQELGDEWEHANNWS